MVFMAMVIIGGKKMIKNHIKNNNLNKMNSQIDVLVNKLQISQKKISDFNIKTKKLEGVF